MTLCKERVPTTVIGSSFTYLGKSFSFNMNVQNVREDILNDLEIYITKIDKLPIHPKLKIHILTTYVYSKLKWPMSIYKLGDTWIKQKCDMLVVNYVRRWLNFHPGANIKHLCLSCKRLGLNLKLPSYIYNSCQITTRRLMKHSTDEDINKLYIQTKTQETVQQDEILESAWSGDQYVDKTKCLKIQKSKIEEQTWTEFVDLKKQSIIIKFITDFLPTQRITSWQKVVDKMPANIFSFCRRALILALPTYANLKTWNIIPENICTQCKVKPQTQHHVLNNCEATVKEGRLTWRHDSVLYTISHHLQILSNKGYAILADIPEYLNPANLFTGLCPDIALCFGNLIIAVELTICFETNFKKSRKYKEDRYKNLKDHLNDRNKELKLYYVEFSSLGFTSADMTEFTKWLRPLGVDINRMITISTEVCIRTSYYIFNRRNKEWTSPLLMKYT